MDETKEFYTAEELANILQINKMSVYRMMNRGEISYHQIGKVKRISRADFDEYLAKTRRTQGEGE